MKRLVSTGHTSPEGSWYEMKVSGGVVRIAATLHAE